MRRLAFVVLALAVAACTWRISIVAPGWSGAVLDAGADATVPHRLGDYPVPQGPAGGGLTGSYPNPGLDGGAILAAFPDASTGWCMVRDGGVWIGIPCPSVSPSGAAGGNLIGTYPNPGLDAAGVLATIGVLGPPNGGTGNSVYGTNGQWVAWDGGQMIPVAAPLTAQGFVYTDAGGTYQWPTADGGILAVGGAGGVPFWLQGNTTGQSLFWDGGAPQWQVPASSALHTPQAFTSSGTYTPAYTGWGFACGFGGGGAGGSGGSGGVNPDSAGGGGAAIYTCYAVQVSSGVGVTVTIGAAATGGAGVNNANGNNGSDGANATFGSLAIFKGASGGQGGSAASNNGGGSGGSPVAGSFAGGTLDTLTGSSINYTGLACGGNGGNPNNTVVPGSTGGANTVGGFSGGSAGATYGGGGGAAGVGGNGTNGGAGNASSSLTNAGANSGAGGGGSGYNAAGATATGASGGTGQITFVPLG